jgi:hypothetical protein
MDEGVDAGPRKFAKYTPRPRHFRNDAARDPRRLDEIVAYAEVCCANRKERPGWAETAAVPTLLWRVEYSPMKRKMGLANPSSDTPARSVQLSGEPSRGLQRFPAGRRLRARVVSFGSAAI